MKRTKLYKDITNGRICTFEELKQEYADANGCELPIDDESFLSIIYENLFCVGGSIEILHDNDEVLNWCNDYAEVVEAGRVMCREEIEESTRDIYLGIVENDSFLIEATKDNIFEDMEIYKRLETI